MFWWHSSSVARGARKLMQAFWASSATLHLPLMILSWLTLRVWCCSTNWGYQHFILFIYYWQQRVRIMQTVCKHTETKPENTKHTRRKTMSLKHMQNAPSQLIKLLLLSVTAVRLGTANDYGKLWKQCSNVASLVSRMSMQLVALYFFS